MAGDEIDSAIEDFQSTVAEIARLQQERARLTATATAARRRVSVTVNADGIAIDIRFSGDIGELSYDEIAAAVTEASQHAVADIARRKAELTAPAVGHQQAPDIDSLAATVNSLREFLR
jgi:DNA-binding protein YbaB